MPTTTIKQPVGAKTALTVTGLSTLASAAYVASAVINNTTSQPLDVAVEVSVTTTNAPSGNKQIIVFAKASYDNLTWQSGPESGTDATSEGNLTFLGVINTPTASTTETKSFSIASAYGFLPPYVLIVLRNDLGVTLTSGSASTAEISTTAS